MWCLIVFPLITICFFRALELKPAAFMFVNMWGDSKSSQPLSGSECGGLLSWWWCTAYSRVVFTVSACSRLDRCEPVDLAKSKTVPPFSKGPGHRVIHETPSARVHTHTVLHHFRGRWTHSHPFPAHPAQPTHVVNLTFSQNHLQCGLFTSWGLPLHPQRAEGPHSVAA